MVKDVGSVNTGWDIPQGTNDEIDSSRCRVLFDVIVGFCRFPSGGRLHALQRLTRIVARPMDALLPSR